VKIRFANWQPDLQGLTNPGMQDAKNVYPIGGGGYGPIKALAEVSTTGLSATCQGAISAIDSTGTTQTFAGDASKLYKLTAGVFSDVSKGGGYSVGTTDRWEFVQYGQRVIATQISNPPQYYDLGSSTLFADLAGSPPQARHAAVVRDFVVLGNTATSPNQLAWSGFNDSAGWTAGSNQSDTQTLQGGGWIQAIVGGEVGYIFQEHAITRMTYVGPPAIFQFDAVETARGLAAPAALIKLGSLVYYWAQDGFYVFDGAQSVSIGDSKVDNWFSTHLQGNTFAQITCGADPANKLVYWSFVSTDAVSAANPDTVIIYNWLTKEWSYAKFAHEMLFSDLTQGVTLEQLSAQYPIIENVPVSFDSRVWTGGAAYLSAFDTSHQLCNFSGSNLAAILEPSDQEPIPGRRSLVTNIRPFVDTSAVTAIVRSRERFADSTKDTSAASMQASGDIPVTSSGRFHRPQLTIPAASTWTFASGLEMDAEDDGEI